ncbi:hypothetical protein J6590_049750 [Homalodisca vitripennis]|nr:hypothetical protein J6590_049750 [Homalodisca vitripennis]
MFKIEKTRTGKPCIIFNGIKYRHYRVLKNGETSWRCLGRSCGASIKTDVNQILVTAGDQTHTGEHPVTMRRSCHRCPAHPRRPTRRLQHPRLSAPRPTQTLHRKPHHRHLQPLPRLLLYHQPARHLALPLVHLTRPRPLNQKIFDLQEQMKVILDHSIESDQKLLEYTDQVFVARSSVNVSTSPPHAKNQYCQTTDSFNRSCERCPLLKEEVQNMLTTIKTLEEEIKTLKNEKLLSFEKLNSIQTPNNIIISNSYEILSKIQEEDDTYTAVATKKKKRKSNKKKQTNHSIEKCKTKKEYMFAENKKEKLPFKTVSIVGDSHARHLASMMRGVDGVTNVCGTCKPGAGLLNTIPDAAPPPDNCFVLISGNNDVAAGRQNIIFNNLEEIIKNCRTSKVLITPLCPRHDLPPDSPIQETIRVANAYISELCVRSEGLFTSHGQHLRESGKRLLTCLMIAHLATMAPDPRHHQPPLVAAPSHSLPTAMSRTEGGPDPDLQETPKQPRVLLFESFADAVKSTGHQQHGNILEKQNFLGNPLLVTKTN